MLAQLTAACIATAAGAYHIPLPTFYAILRVEGGMVGAASVNPNGTEDLGPFQINTSWLPALRAYFRLRDNRASYELIRDNGCANATAAAAILLYEWRRAGRLDLAVAWYHSHDPLLGRAYLGRVSAAQSALLRPQPSRLPTSARPAVLRGVPVHTTQHPGSGSP